MGKDLHPTILLLFEKVLNQHSNVSSFRRLPNEDEYVYEIRRKRHRDTVRVWLADQYLFDEMNFINRPVEIKRGDYILIAKPESAWPDVGHNQYFDPDSRIRVGKLKDFMGALNKAEMWLYDPPKET